MRKEGGRYFLSKTRISAISFGSFVVFGAAFWGLLSDDQRLATAGHEFVHIRSADGIRRAKRVILPSVVFSGFFFLTWALSFRNYLNEGVVLVGVTLTLLVYLLGFFVSTLANAGWNRRNELRCDVEAAGYVDREAMISALEMWESMVSEKTRKSFAYKLASRAYPTLAQRRDAIRRGSV
jgi:Zn-dependent protease with chaperone function